MVRHTRQMKTKGKFFWKYKWYSICSMHYNHDPNCNMCNCGTWTNVWTHAIGSVIYKLFPSLWRWYMNLPFNKRNFLKRLNSEHP